MKINTLAKHLLKENSPLDSFLVINNNSGIFSILTIDIIFFFLVPTLFFTFILSSTDSFNSLSLIYTFVKKIFNLFFNLYKTLINSIRLERYFIFILSIFIFILFTNLSGFFLLELPITSHAIITLFLSFILFFNYTITSIIVNNQNFYKLFLINKLELILKVPLFVIELISYFVRPFSLGVRLFSNILSGHILVHIFFSAFLFMYKISFWLSLIIFLMVLFILSMEIFVSFVQSYIFFILSIIYLQDIFLKH